MPLYETTAGDAERGGVGVAGTCQMQAEAEAPSNGETPAEMCRDIKGPGQENPEENPLYILIQPVLFNSG